ncbi:hypothetical protein L218DRAFT_942096 [Marasmius fiardii PR-910]|nr:hypothetical protein L218DRAFT_942096 [Marasmius fiardii PR-910]
MLKSLSINDANLWNKNKTELVALAHKEVLKILRSNGMNVPLLITTLDGDGNKQEFFLCNTQDLKVPKVPVKTKGKGKGQVTNDSKTNKTDNSKPASRPHQTHSSTKPLKLVRFTLQPTAGDKDKLDSDLSEIEMELDTKQPSASSTPAPANITKLNFSQASTSVTAADVQHTTNLPTKLPTKQDLSAFVDNANDANATQHLKCACKDNRVKVDSTPNVPGAMEVQKGSKIMATAPGVQGVMEVQRGPEATTPGIQRAMEVIGVMVTTPNVQIGSTSAVNYGTAPTMATAASSAQMESNISSCSSTGGVYIQPHLYSMPATLPHAAATTGIHMNPSGPFHAPSQAVLQITPRITQEQLNTFLQIPSSCSTGAFHQPVQAIYQPVLDGMYHQQGPSTYPQQFNGQYQQQGGGYWQGGVQGTGQPHTEGTGKLQ